MRVQSVLVIAVLGSGSLLGCGKGKDQPLVEKQGEVLKRIETGAEEAMEHEQVRMGANHHAFSLTHSDNQIKNPHVEEEHAERSDSSSSESKEHKDSLWDRLTGKSHKKGQKSLDSGSETHSSDSDGKTKKSSWSMSRWFSKSSDSADATSVDHSSSGSKGEGDSSSSSSESNHVSKGSEGTSKRSSSWNIFRR